MESESVQVNEILQIKAMDDPNALPCHTRVEDIAGGCIVIAWPLDRGSQIPVQLEQQLMLSFVREEAAYVFAAVVQEKGQAPVPYLKIRPLGHPRKIQRREFFRVKVAIDVEIAGVISHPAQGEMVLYFKSHTYDLSGGGMAIRLEKNIPVGSMLEVKLFLFDGLAPLKIIARVVNSVPVQSVGGRTLSRIGMSFPGITETERRRIMRYLFQMQRNQASGPAGRTPGDSHDA